MKALLVPSDGNPRIVELADDDKALRDLIGGYVEMVRLADGLGLMWVDEDGKDKGLEVNQLATWLGRQAGTRRDDFVVGTCVITDSKPPDLAEVKGTTVRYLNRLVGVYDESGAMLPDDWNGWGDE
jgi:hypothetical protein